MSKLKNFISNLNDSNDATNIAARFGMSDIKAQNPVVSGNQNNNNSEGKMKNVVTLGHRADGVAVTSADMEKDVFGWYKHIVTFTDEGTQVYQLQQSMTMANPPADFRITSESDFQAEVRRAKAALGLN